MDERWGLMLETLRESFTSDSEVGDLERFLVSKGLNGREIDEVLALYFANSDASPVHVAVPHTPGPGRRKTSIRVQGPHERGRFTTEAWGYLISLHEGGVLESSDFELFVERALFITEGRISLPDLRLLAEDAGFQHLAAGTDRTLLH